MNPAPRSTREEPFATRTSLERGKALGRTGKCWSKDQHPDGEQVPAIRSVKANRCVEVGHAIREPTDLGHDSHQRRCRQLYPPVVVVVDDVEVVVVVVMVVVVMVVEVVEVTGEKSTTEKSAMSSPLDAPATVSSENR